MWILLLMGECKHRFGEGRKVATALKNVWRKREEMTEATEVVVAS